MDLVAAPTGGARPASGVSRPWLWTSSALDRPGCPGAARSPLVHQRSERTASCRGAAWREVQAAGPTAHAMERRPSETPIGPRAVGTFTAKVTARFPDGAHQVVELPARREPLAREGHGAEVAKPSRQEHPDQVARDPEQQRRSRRQVTQIASIHPPAEPRRAPEHPGARHLLGSDEVAHDGLAAEPGPVSSRGQLQRQTGFTAHRVVGAPRSNLLVEADPGLQRFGANGHVRAQTRLGITGPSGWAGSVTV